MNAAKARRTAAIAEIIGTTSKIAFALSDTPSPAVSPAIQNATARVTEQRDADVKSVVSALPDES
jgi:hypothetical protein